MIIVDYSLISYATIISQLVETPNLQLTEGLVKHSVLNTIRANYKKFRPVYGQNLVIACDSPNSWRKDFFPYYKANRKEKINDFNIDWDWFFKTVNTLKNEIQENFPYLVTTIDKAEADDIIAVISRRVANNQQRVLVLSRDKDFNQLLDDPNIEQFDPINKGFIKIDDVKKHLKEHIIRGDKGDGVPNILSPDNCLVIGERQKSIMQKKLDVWLTEDKFDDPVMVRNFERNKVLIDFNYIPKDIVEKINTEYMHQYLNNTMDKSKIFNYFMNNKLRDLMENINDF
jgi:hypothetical protein